MTVTPPRPDSAEIQNDELRSVPARHLQLMGRALVAAGLVMVPWLVVLATTLPATARAAHWSAAWVGLDAAEACFLFATGLLLIRQDERCSLTAAITATLVLTDAWFDVLTSAPGAGKMTAVVLAACVEVPVAGLCATLAARTFPRRGRSPCDAARGALSVPLDTKHRTVPGAASTGDAQNGQLGSAVDSQSLPR